MFRTPEMELFPTFCPPNLTQSDPDQDGGLRGALSPLQALKRPVSISLLEDLYTEGEDGTASSTCVDVLDCMQA